MADVASYARSASDISEFYNATRHRFADGFARRAYPVSTAAAPAASQSQLMLLGVG